MAQACKADETRPIWRTETMPDSLNNPGTDHTPVLLRETLELLSCAHGGSTWMPRWGWAATRSDPRVHPARRLPARPDRDENRWDCTGIGWRSMPGCSGCCTRISRICRWC